MRNRVGRPWFVVLLVFALFAPTFDIFICANDKEPTPSTSVTQLVKAYDSHTDKSSAPAQDPDDAGCPHGHCHHGFSAVKLVEATEFSVVAREAEMPMRPTQRPPGLPVNDLLRPPRA